MTEHKMGFVAKVIKGGKITIPHEIRNLLDIKIGDIVDVPEIKKVKSVK